MTDWKHASFYRFERSIPSSTGVAEVVIRIGSTNVNAYLKPIGNRAGSHVLACELIGSQLARWFGLPTLDFGIMQIEPNDEIPLGSGCHAEPGPAFVSQKERGDTWSGAMEALHSLLNTEDITNLVIFDTWILNADRFPPAGMDRKPNYDNVFLSDRDGIVGKRRLIAMDHTHCITNGSAINAKVSAITRVKDDRLYGFFPEFKPFITAGRVEKAAEKISTFSSTLVEEVLAAVPFEWGVSRNGIKALRDFFLDRAHFLAEKVYDMVLGWRKKQWREVRDTTA